MIDTPIEEAAHVLDDQYSMHVVETLIKSEEISEEESVLNLNEYNLQFSEETKQEKLFSCNQCDYKGIQAELWQHKKYEHGEVRYPCDKCDYAATQKGKLKYHKEAKHQGVRYHCDLCEYSAKRPDILKEHKESKHEGIKYPCDQCEYSACRPATLRQHKESKHEGIRYPCDQCDYAGTEPSSLRKHKRALHEGIRYSCDVCDFKATQPTYLRKHRRKMHGIYLGKLDIITNDVISPVKSNIFIPPTIEYPTTETTRSDDFQVNTLTNLEFHCPNE